MSVKLYSGFAYTGDVRALMATFDSFRPWLEREAQRVLDEFLARNAERGKAFVEWLKLRHEIKRTGERFPLVDTDFSVTVFPRGPRSWVGLVYTEHEAWRSRFMRLPRIREFGYWNNTDEPEGMTRREWARRNRVWSEVLLDKPTGIPSMYGLSIELVDPNGPMPRPIPEAK